MNYQRFKQEIDTKKPKYLSKYYNLIEAISRKGDTQGGYIQLGAFYQTYMYAFMIGYHIGECTPISGNGDARDFAPIASWKPIELVDYIQMLILSEHEEKLGFKWIDLDTMDDDKVRECISTMMRRIEGYANTGLAYIQKKYDEEKEAFKSPFVFVNILREVTKKSGC